MIYTLLACFFYSVIIITGSIASRNINTNVSTAIINTISAMLPIAFVLPILTAKSTQNSQKGILFSIITGVLVTLFTLSIAKAYSSQKVNVVAPIVFGGATFLSTTVSYIIFHEKISKVHMYGLLFLALGFGLVIYARWTNQ